MNNEISVAGNHFAYIDDAGDVMLVDYGLNAVRVILPTMARSVKLNETYMFILDDNDELHVFEGRGRELTKINSILYVTAFAISTKQKNIFMYISQRNIYWVNLDTQDVKLRDTIPIDGTISHFSITIDEFASSTVPYFDDHDAYIVLDDNKLLVYHVRPVKYFNTIGIGAASHRIINEHWFVYLFLGSIEQMESRNDYVYIINHHPIGDNFLYRLGTDNTQWIIERYATNDIMSFAISRREGIISLNIFGNFRIRGVAELLKGDRAVFIQEGIHRGKEYYILVGKSGTLYRRSSTGVITAITPTIAYDMDISNAF